MSKQYPGYNELDRQTEYAPFFNEKMSDLPTEVSTALLTGAHPWGTLPELSY